MYSIHNTVQCSSCVVRVSPHPACAMWTSVQYPVRFHTAQYIIPCDFTTMCDAIPGEFIEIRNPLRKQKSTNHALRCHIHRDFMRFVNSYRCVISHFLSFHRDFYDVTPPHHLRWSAHVAHTTQDLGRVHATEVYFWFCRGRVRASRAPPLLELHPRINLFDSSAYDPCPETSA